MTANGDSCNAMAIGAFSAVCRCLVSGTAASSWRPLFPSAASSSRRCSFLRMRPLKIAHWHHLPQLHHWQPPSHLPSPSPSPPSPSSLFPFVAFSFSSSLKAFALQTQTSTIGHYHHLHRQSWAKGCGPSAASSSSSSSSSFWMICWRRKTACWHHFHQLIHLRIRAPFAASSFSSWWLQS